MESGGETLDRADVTLWPASRNRLAYRVRPQYAMCEAVRELLLSVTGKEQRGRNGQWGLQESEVYRVASVCLVRGPGGNRCQLGLH